MNKNAHQHQWNSVLYQLRDFYLEQFGNSATSWQEFHQASALCSTDYNSSANLQMGIEKIKKLQHALMTDPYRSLKLIALPTASRIHYPLSEAIINRMSCRKNMIPKTISLQDLSDFLYYGYGLNQKGFKNAPSAGALYPLDIYVYCANIEVINPGLYYYVSEEHGLKCLSQTKKMEEFVHFFADQLIYEIVHHASLYIFITASFLKNIWKYSERGYRFSLIEAGHIAQNLDLIASAKNLSCINIGGFHDAEVNQFLELDGVFDANLYLIGLGYSQ